MKGIVSAVLIMLVTCSVGVPVSSTPLSGPTPQPLTRGSVLYVGGSGPNNYTSIQAAIDNASNGDTVFVYDDSSPYHESLIVNKSIYLIGENRDTTTIEGPENSAVVKLVVDAITMEGFTIVIPSNQSTWGIGVWVSKMPQWPNAKDEIIQNITVSDIKVFTGNPNSSGIDCLYCNHGVFRDTDIIGAYYGIQLFLSSSNTVSHNVVAQCGTGISVMNTWNPRYRFWFAHPQFGGNNISRNIVRNNSIGISIDGDRTTNDKILENNVTENDIGVGLGTTIKTEIARNNIINNNKDATIETAKLTLYPTNKWHDNYWGKPKNFPVPIVGKFWFIIWVVGGFGETNFASGFFLGKYPIIAFDRTPAQAPYPL